LKKKKKGVKEGRMDKEILRAFAKYCKKGEAVAGKSQEKPYRSRGEVGEGRKGSRKIHFLKQCFFKEEKSNRPRNEFAMDKPSSKEGRKSADRRGHISRLDILDLLRRGKTSKNPQNECKGKGGKIKRVREESHEQMNLWGLKIFNRAALSGRMSFSAQADTHAEDTGEKHRGGKKKEKKKKEENTRARNFLTLDPRGSFAGNIGEGNRCGTSCYK